MTFVSYGFGLFLILLLVLYYGCPKGFRPGLLCLASALYLCLAGGVKSLFVYGVSAFLVWIAALGIEKGRTREADGGIEKGLFWGTLAVLLVLLAAFQYRNFPGYTMEEISWLTGREYQWEPVETGAPLAISFYTLTLTGYLTEVYWGILKAEKNPLRLALFGGFFPQMAMGPIVRYGEVSPSLFQGEGFSAENFFAGLERMLWGFFQKLVLSERLAVMVNTVYGDYETYSGSFLILGAVAFALQLYTDFNGAMDIALGTARLFGVSLAENFRRPFASRTIAEFWRRWHMTLGAWFRDFVMYPLQKTGAFQAIGAFGKKWLGKKQGKKLSAAAALLSVWFLLGLWHGGKWTFIIGSGLYHGILMAAALMTEPWQKKFYEKTGIRREHPLWTGFQRLRTFVLVAVGFVFFRSDSLKMALGILKGMFSGNLGLFTGEGLASLGLSGPDGGVLLCGLILFLAVSRSLEKEKKERNLAVCGASCAVLAFLVLIWGCYGRGYDPSAFIYASF